MSPNDIPKLYENISIFSLRSLESDSPLASFSYPETR